MKYLIISNTLVIYCDGKPFTIEPSDSRHELLMTLMNESPVNEEKVKDILYLRLTDKVKNCEIKDGQLLINNEIVPEPFLGFLLKEKNDLPRFEFFYNLYFSLSKQNRAEDLTIFKSLINNKLEIAPFSAKEEICLVAGGGWKMGLPNNSVFKVVNELVTEEMMMEFVKTHFKKNVYKSLKQCFWRQNNIVWKPFTENLKFLLNFKENEDKFFSTIDEISAENVNLSQSYFFMNKEGQAQLLAFLSRLQIKNFSQLKRFFGGWKNFWQKFNQLHIIDREIVLFQELYTNQVFFSDYSKLTYTQYVALMDQKLKEWRKHHDVYAYTFFNLPSRHPWLLDLKPMEHETWGSLEFNFPHRGLELELWSNAMNNCIRGYKRALSESPGMILLNILCPQQRVMLATLELQIDFFYEFKEPSLNVKQFVSYSNQHMRTQDQDLYEAAVKQLYEKFTTYLKKHPKSTVYHQGRNY